VATLRTGCAPLCPACTSSEESRGLVGKRPRGVGRLRPSVVLYGEEHRDGERVGAVVQRDLTGKGKGNRCGDLLIVVGTSLRVPGTKRIVREFAKSVKSSYGSKPTTSTETQLPTPVPSPRRSPDQNSSEEVPPIRTIFINYEFPVPSREWEGVFDVWVKGDAQRFAELVSDGIRLRDEQRRKRRKTLSKDLECISTGLLTPQSTPKRKRKHLDISSPSTDPAKLDSNRNVSKPEKAPSRVYLNGRREMDYFWLLPDPQRLPSINTIPAVSSLRSTQRGCEESYSPQPEDPTKPSFGIRNKLLPSPPLTPAKIPLQLV